MKFPRWSPIEVTSTGVEDGMLTVHFRIRKWHPAYWAMFVGALLTVRLEFSRR